MQNAIQYLRRELSSCYEAPELNRLITLVIKKLTGFSSAELIVNKNTVFSSEQKKEIQDITEKLRNFVPVQYILGETEFFGMTFLVNESVLIPRPETEELVEWIAGDNAGRHLYSLLDIGTGSGCIAISLKKLFAAAQVDAFDISDEALKTAQLNAQMNQLEVHFFRTDILNQPDTDRKWDIIVSNPPYIPEDEKNDMHPNVLNHEPHVALFVPDDDPLLFYREIAAFAKNHLQPEGKLFFEINYNAGSPVTSLLVEMGYKNVELKKDLSGNNRMVKATAP